MLLFFWEGREEFGQCCNKYYAAFEGNKQQTKLSRVKLPLSPAKKK